jgi:amino acid transporter
MARTGALPPALARISSTYRTPVTAIYLQTAVAVAICLAAGLPLGPYNLFNLLGTTGTFVYIPIFILMNVAAFRYFRRQHPEEFSTVRFVVCPVVSTLALLTIGYKSVVPLPAMPVAWAPVLAGAYLLLGVAVLVGRNLRAGRRDWMAHAGELPDVA